MPRYFFNVRNGIEAFDDVGTELAGVAELRVHMVAIAMELVEKSKAGAWEVEALDEAGKILATMVFCEPVAEK